MSQVHWLDVMLAPLTWLERARGRRRLALLSLYALILSVVGVLVGREAVLWQLPDAPEPFDLARYGHVNLADSDNAMFFYKQAVGLFAPGREAFEGLPKGAGDESDWTRADPKVRAWAEANRAALEVWLKGTERPDALLGQPEQLESSIPWQVVNGLGTLAQFGTLEATRRRESGDLEGAWTCHRAAIRSGLHVGRHGDVPTAYVGLNILRQAIPKAMAWVDDPRATPDSLRRAVADLAACRALMSSASDLVRMGYLHVRADLGEPNGWHRSRLVPDHPMALLDHLPAAIWAKGFLLNEPKRSLKILRLITSGELAQCDRTSGPSALVVSPNFRIYAIDARTPPVLARIRPEDLVGWADASGLWGFGIGSKFAFCEESAQATEGLLDRLRLRVAERAFSLDHKGRSPRVYGDLFPTYLDALPTGVMAGDLLAAP